MTGEILDQPEEIRRLDRSGMAELIADFPRQIKKSPAIVDAAQWSGWVPPPPPREFDGVIVLGMGGSAIGGDLVRSFLAPILAVPMSVVRDYRLPRFVTQRTLVFVSSYSGNTEETLSAFTQARSRGCRCVALTSGGELGQPATASDYPIIRLPEGIPPRAALGFSFSTLLLCLGKAGLISPPDQSLLELAEFLAGRTSLFTPEVPLADNVAKRLAVRIHGRIPVIYGAAGAMAVVALRWKGQFCENAKNLAFAGEAPEFNHNEVCGWGLPEGSPNQFIALILRYADDHPRITKRLEIVRPLFEEKGIKVEPITAAGDNPLSRLFSLIQLGDWVSFYLAVLNKVDPTSIAAIDYLKKKLAAHEINR